MVKGKMLKRILLVILLVFSVLLIRLEKVYAKDSLSIGKTEKIIGVKAKVKKAISNDLSLDRENSFTRTKDFDTSKIGETQIMTISSPLLRVPDTGDTSTIFIYIIGIVVPVTLLIRIIILKKRK